MTSRDIRGSICDIAVTAFAIFALTLLLPPSPALAQTPADPGTTTVRPYFRNVSRIESWSFFEPPAGQGDPTYTFVWNRGTLGLRVTSRKLDVEGAFQYAQIFGLPRRSIGSAGPLGTGALYFDAARATESYQFYLKSLHARVKNVLPSTTITAGRMPYASGEEALSGRPPIEEVKRLRLGARLIGEFEWSVFQRAYDGVRVDVDRQGWRATGAILFPTQGGFEESANPTMTDIRVATGAVTFAPDRLLRNSEVQLFAYHYHDDRAVRGRPDNAGVLAAAADISVATIGGSQVGVFPVRGGEIDTVAWVAAQTGDWYGLDHRALSVALEGGYRRKAWWTPWIRGGWLFASGDSDASDDRHGTFFQMVPTSRRYSRSTTYAQMNVRDLFAQLSLQPQTRLIMRAELHRVWLASTADRWYAGSGATAREGNSFGFLARQSRGFRSLGTLIDAMADVRITPWWTMNGYFGMVFGGDVVRGTFVDDRLRFVYFENVLSF